MKPTKTDEEVKAGTKVPFHDRPGEPYRETPLEETIFKSMRVDQTRHHIIPWNTLSEFARTAYEMGHTVHLKSALGVAIKTMMDNSPRYQGRRALAADEEGGTRKQGSVTVGELKQELRHTGDAALNSEALLAISTAYCWMPGNLFLGPLNTLRLDDPDEDFEGHADDQVPELERYRAAFAAIKDYVKSEAPSEDAATKIAGFLQWVAAKTEPIPFDESAWSQVSDHRVDDKGKERGASYYLNKAADTVQVRAKLQLIDAAHGPWYRKTVEETNAWHKAQQAVWAQQRAAAKVPVL
jgi:hypothetical protein